MSCLLPFLCKTTSVVENTDIIEANLTTNVLDEVKEPLSINSDIVNDDNDLHPNDVVVEVEKEKEVELEKEVEKEPLLVTVEIEDAKVKEST